jgi:hypothetical protein
VRLQKTELVWRASQFYDRLFEHFDPWVAFLS